MIIKLVIIIVIIVIFLIVVTKQIENFTDKNYINTNINPPDYNKIYSSLPYDIKVKNENMVIYDYGNDELNDKFNIIFNINPSKQINLIEGINWSKWIDNNEINYLSLLGTYYNNTINNFKEKLKDNSLKLPNNNDNFNIINQTLNRYKIALNNKNIYLLDIDIIIYRNKKPLARHIKIISVCNNNYTTFLMIKIIGVINECSLNDDKLKSASENNSLAEFIPEREIVYDMNSYIYDIDDKIVNSQISYNLYNNLLKDLK